MPYSETGLLADPAFRRERARKAARARTELAAHIRAVVDRAPELTDEQCAQLRALLAPSPGPAAPAQAAAVDAA